ncbi:7-cyano-7-deazaguanine synthase [Marchantia polymorpha subsp. ruderalis]|uniref:7-cyano-7-deazaguanine synthase n=2 Tax=Marchantia polymorpha TaxID=3197 RepID=A0AAF6B6S0_MARPO|nr:hypothetical protein MARPO_0087s0012 [Marchantia polymorpha]BBN07704.1 hypothetical protein Mp_4g05790 [Marchantia polymorpha subsp. ruderalis]|eukprot:PTQ33569.1 hypothetical protein MARPO_0087s0012 [Marchantia polymorpha]
MAGQGASVLLMSGGLESATILWHWKRSARLFPLFVNYGQRGAQMEERASEKLCSQLEIELSKFDLSKVGDSFRALQHPTRLHVPVPNRNLLLLALGASYASQVGADTLALTLNKDDLGTYSSSSQSFVNSFRATAAVLDPPIEVVAPLSHFTKAEVVRFANDLGVPLSDTYSCMIGRAHHCGRCSQCKLRREAFLSARVSEPPDFYE